VLFCADIYRALDRGTNGKETENIESTRTVDQITLDHRTVTDIQTKLVKWGKRGVVSRHLHTKDDKETIATWRLDPGGILQVFGVHSVT